jgi:hypothetical protein
MANGKLITSLYVPKAGTTTVSIPGLVFRDVIAVFRESKVHFRVSTTPTGTEYKYSSIFGRLYFDSSNPFDGVEKLTLIYKSLI